MLKALYGAGPVSIREASRRVDGDVSAVHADVAALLLAGLLDRTESGQIEFPYDAVKVQFVLEAAELNRTMNLTVQQRRFACCCPEGHRGRC